MLITLNNCTLKIKINNLIQNYFIIKYNNNNLKKIIKISLFLEYFYINHSSLEMQRLGGYSIYDEE